MRPITNADHPSVAKARVFLKKTGYSIDETNEDNFKIKDIIKTLKSNGSYNSMSNDLLESMRSLVEKCDIKFYQSISDNELINEIVTQAAIYTPNTLTDENDDNLIDNFIGVEDEYKTSIKSGDCILLRTNFNEAKSQSIINSKKVNNWLLVLETDILFARIKVVNVPPPPTSWTVKINTFSAVWLPISVLWDVIVCRPEYDLDNTLIK